jgi:hypothetical protein
MGENQEIIYSTEYCRASQRIAHIEASCRITEHCRMSQSIRASHESVTQANYNERIYDYTTALPARVAAEDPEDLPDNYYSRIITGTVGVQI